METYEYAGKVYHEVEARMLWSLGHYDGPMSGIALYNGKPHYAKCHQSACAKKKPRYFWLYPLTDEEFRRENLYQEMFRHYYGIHCDYEEDGWTRKTATSKSNWNPGPLDFTGLRCLDFLLRLLVGPIVNAATGSKPDREPWRPTYSEMEKAAGTRHSGYPNYSQDRFAVGYFKRTPKTERTTS